MRVSLVLFAASVLVLSGCTSSSDGADSAASPESTNAGTETGGTETGGTEAGGGATADAGGAEQTSGTSTEEQLSAQPETPSAFVTWGDNETAFVLVQCDSSGPSSLTASGDDVAGGLLLTIDVTDGGGKLSIAEDATLETTLAGTVGTLAMNGTAFQGSGNYQTKSGESRDFTFQGDCRDL